MRNKIKNLVILICVSIFNFCCSSTQKNDDQTINRSVDNLAIKKDSNIIETLKIGDQVWMKNNLNIDVFRNGDLIKEAKSLSEWRAAIITHQPAWCYFNNDYNNGKKFGKLYNYYAVEDERGLAPVGWHIPSKYEFIKLLSFLNGSDKVDSNKLKFKLNSLTGFSQFLSGGVRFNYDWGDRKMIFSQGFYICWWSSTTYDSYYNYKQGVRSKVCIVLQKHNDNSWWGEWKQEFPDYGFYVRCIKD